MRISGTYTPIKWDEVDLQVIDGRMKSTKASVEFQFGGDIEALATVEYLMYYTSFDPADLHKSQAQYVGQIRIVEPSKEKQEASPSLIQGLSPVVSHTHGSRLSKVLGLRSSLQFLVPENTRPIRMDAVGNWK